MLAVLLASLVTIQDPWVIDPADPRTAYDALDYRLDLHLDPDRGFLQGVAGVRVRVLAEEMPTLVLDLHRALLVDGVSGTEESLGVAAFTQATPLRYTREGDSLRVTGAAPWHRGEEVTVLVQYSGLPVVLDDFTGFHFRRTADGQPWIGPSVQTIGAHTWWPCKASFFHPEDKNERLWMNLTVPEGLTAAAVGRLEGVDDEGGLRTFRWYHDYPLPTYAVSFLVAPFVETKRLVELPGLDQPLEVWTYLLPEDAEKGRRQFEEVPEVLAFFSEKFGPYPFPRSKFALAEAPYWGMEHCTLIGYGNSFPRYLQEEGLPDPFERTNGLYDYILIHEAAHEWWGNCISARTWGDFWLHEGFATYAEALWVEHQHGLEAYLDFMASKRDIPTTATVFRPLHENAGQAYNGPHTNAIYDKGAHVLHMLRYLMGDAPFFEVLKEFATDPAFRYRTATSVDFQRLCERRAGRSLRGFFDPWLYGTGWPHFTVRTATLEGPKANLEIDCRGRSLFDYEMPVEVVLHCDDGSRHVHRPIIREGVNKFSLEAPAPVTRVEYTGFRWILCRVTIVP